MKSVANPPSKKNWEILTRPGTLSTVYIAYMVPKRLSEGIELIYGKSARDVNQKPVIEARRKLQALDYLEVRPGKKSLRDVILKSKAEPFIQYADCNLVSRGKISAKEDYPAIMSEEKRIFKLIVDSNWFRETFFNSVELRETYDRNIHHGFFQITSGKYIVADAMGMMGELLETIATIAEVFGRISWHDELFPKTSDLKGIDSFDVFAKNWYSKKIKKDYEFNRVMERTFVFAHEYLGRYISTNRFLIMLFENPYFLCIPQDMLDKLSRIQRIQTTYFTAFDKGLKMALKSKRKVSINKLRKGFGSLDLFRKRPKKIY